MICFLLKLDWCVTKYPRQLFWKGCFLGHPNFKILVPCQPEVNIMSAIFLEMIFNVAFTRMLNSTVDSSPKYLKSHLKSLNGNTQCGNSRIFHPLRFFVKSILVILKPKNCHFYHLSSSEFWIFGNLLPFQVWNLSRFKAFNIVKMAVFDLLKSANIDLT